MRLSRRIRALTIGIAVLPAASFARAQAPPATCADWTAVQSWTGTVTVSGSGQSTDQNGNTYITSQQATIRFTATSNPGNSCGPQTLDSWLAQGSQATYSVNIQDVFNTTCIDTKNPLLLDPLVVHYDVSNGSSSAGNVGLQMDFGQTPPTYSVGFGEIVDNVMRSSPGNPACNAQSYSVTDPQDPWGPGTLLQSPAPTSMPLPAKVSPLIGSVTFGSYDATFGLGSNATWTVSWNFSPVLDVDVVVTIPDYLTWRPTAGRNETDPGANPLIIKAQLVKKGTNQLATGVIPDKWSFSLIYVSHEPGVSMNWPSMADRADPSPPDMTFNKQLNLAFNPYLTLLNNDTVAEIDNPSQTTDPQEVDVLLVPFDWGGWATLNVIATVQGFPIKGHLQLPHGQNVTDILLPLRQPGSHIADVWKNDPAINVPLSTPDDDDSETDPDGLAGCDGDGLTLYEEYRGFTENGKHIEGDPHKKDFFIQNLIGADAEPGIARFTALTQLNVHKDIQKNEMAGVGAGPNGQLGDRIINFNHKDGAHQSFDQHGVIIATCSPQGGLTSVFRDGGKTFLTQDGVRGRPGLTTGICMQGRDWPGRVLSPDNTHRSSLSGGVISVSGALIQYDVGVAHELLHSVGVEHHGDVDPQGEVFTFLPPNNPQNTTGQPVFQFRGQYIRLLREENGSDVATTLWANLQNGFARCQSIVANPSQNDPIVVEYCQEDLSKRNNGLLEGGYLAAPHGEHSGNDHCVMRYFFANFYPSQEPVVGLPVYYLVPAGTEPVGSILDDSPAGTGINDPNRSTPQPRYFDAASGRGDCKHQVCVNDKYPPVPK